MMPNNQPRVSLRQVRSATSGALDGLNQHASLINGQILPHLNALSRELAETKQQLVELRNQFQASRDLDFWGRLRYLVLGR